VRGCCSSTFGFFCLEAKAEQALGALVWRKMAVTVQTAGLRRHCRGFITEDCVTKLLQEASMTVFPRWDSGLLSEASRLMAFGTQMSDLRGVMTGASTLVWWELVHPPRPCSDAPRQSSHSQRRGGPSWDAGVTGNLTRDLGSKFLYEFGLSGRIIKVGKDL